MKPQIGSLTNPRAVFRPELTEYLLNESTLDAILRSLCVASTRLQAVDGCNVVDHQARPVG